MDLLLAHSAKFNHIVFDADRYSPLPSPQERIQFLVSVQLPVIDSYRSRITSALDAFESISFAFVRAVPGALSIGLPGRPDASVNVNAQNLTTGIEGVQRLCKALLSASYIHASLEAWSEDVLFLELWQDILREPLLREQAQLCTLLPRIGTPRADGEVGNEMIFGEMLLRYSAIITRAEDMMVQQVCGEIEAGLRPHFIASSNNAKKSLEVGVSQTLLSPVALLVSQLSYLRQTLPLLTFTALYRRIASRLSEHILQRQILYRGSFSKEEGIIIQAECELWVESCHSALGGALGGGRNRVTAPWAKLLQAGRIVGADGEVWERITSATFGMSGEEDWENAMQETTGLAELGRQEVTQLLRRREDSS